jgi:hypothetical protein
MTLYQELRERRGELLLDRGAGRAARGILGGNGSGDAETA